MAQPAQLGLGVLQINGRVGALFEAAAQRPSSHENEETAADCLDRA